MNIEYHPAVEQDVLEALRRYDAVSQKLSTEFRNELRRTISAAAKNPSRFTVLAQVSGAQISFASLTILSIAKYSSGIGASPQTAS